jgi:hypothetical protein
MWKDDFYISDRLPRRLSRSAMPMVQWRFSVLMLFPKFAQLLLANDAQAASPFRDLFSQNESKRSI